MNQNDEKLILWKQKKILIGLQNARGNGTSMISLILPPKEQVSKAVQMLQEEYGTASNIKSRVNRLSVLSAIVSAKERLKLYKNIPENGLALYCGIIIKDDGKEKKVNIDIEPYRPINHSLYLCDNKFHVQPLLDVLMDEDKFGFIIMDGNGCLFGTIQGNDKQILQQISVELPKKHGRGGQSALRFARLRLEKRHNYLTKVTELAVHHFIKNNLVSVKGLILAGSAEFKNDLSNSDLLDARIKSKIIKIVDIAYGGINGFNQAIELSKESLGNLKLIEEKNLLNCFFGHIAKDTGLYCFGINEVLFALETGAVETLIVWEDIDMNRIEYRNISEDKNDVIFLTNIQLNEDNNFFNKNNNTEIVDSVSFIDWIVENYQQFGVTLELISDKTSEGSQFCKGFGGIGGILRFQLDNYDETLYSNYDNDDDNIDSDFEELFI